MPTPHGRIWRRLRGSGDDSSDERDEPRLLVRYTVRKTTDIVTQRISFRGGYEKTITFSKRDSYYSRAVEPHDSEVPSEPMDFEGNPVVDRIETDNVCTVEVIESDEVAYEVTKTRWVDASAVGRYLSKHDNVQLLDVKGA